MPSDAVLRCTELLSKLIGRCDLAGVMLIASDDDSGRPVYIVAEGTYSRQIDSLQDLERWVEMRAGKALGVA